MADIHQMPFRFRRWVAVVGLGVLLAACSDNPDLGSGTGFTGSGTQPAPNSPPVVTPSSGPTSPQAGSTIAGASTTAPPAAGSPGSGPFVSSTSVFYTPFSLDVGGGTKVEFSQWFWATLDPAGTVKIIRDGNVILQGPIGQAGPVMFQEPDGTYLFKEPSGAVIVRLAQDDFTEAIADAMRANGLS